MRRVGEARSACGFGAWGPTALPSASSHRFFTCWNCTIHVSTRTERVAALVPLALAAFPTDCKKFWSMHCKRSRPFKFKCRGLQRLAEACRNFGRPHPPPNPRKNVLCSFALPRKGAFKS